MKKWTTIAICMLFALAAGAAPLIYLEQGGAKQVITSGGEIEVQSGGTLDVQSGATVVLSGTGVLARAGLTEDALAKFGVPVESFTILSGGGAFTSLTLEGGTGGFVVKTNDTDNTTATETATFQFRLPENYVATQDVKFSMSSKYVITGDAVAGASNDIDVLAYEVSQTAGTVGADICATSAIAVTASYAVKLFTITATDLVAGDLIRVTVNLRVHDSDAGTGTIASYILAPHFQCDVKG